MKVAVCFGGGGVRGAFQAGVWQAIADLVTPTFTIGSSIGAINAFATTRLTPRELTQWWRSRAPRHVPPQVTRQPAFAALINTLTTLPTRQPWPALALATRLGRPRQIVVRKLGGADTATWLLASAAIPGWLRPVRVGDARYIDGGVLNDLPVDIAYDLGADYVIAIAAAGLGPVPKRQADVLITPPEWAKHMLNFAPAHREQLLAAGVAVGRRLRARLAVEISR
ncbi:patatin-like phospholipase family protein [Lacticaseibacillus nasuensis]|uniref:patatin-like phospholipase family protein n=1 Tax=Lacticaseibacillus nasuensis TaxID=944671 RepID=UPI0007054C95|nr:patatin-like phospholipase family protein [Lacticaseibacillus nasuensis]